MRAARLRSSHLREISRAAYLFEEASATLFEAPVFNGRHPGIDALVNLSRFRVAHIRPAIEWAGTSSSWRPAVSSMAHHLICDYKVPVFLASAWYATDSAADKKRGWFVAHSRGASFRSLDLPVVITEKWNIFSWHRRIIYSIQAIRRAELLSLGVPAGFVEAILSTRLATDLRHSGFWRTCLAVFGRECRRCGSHAGWSGDRLHPGSSARSHAGWNDGIRHTPASFLHEGSNGTVSSAPDAGMASQPGNGRALLLVGTVSFRAFAIR